MTFLSLSGESDTASTDEDLGFRGSGMFEYSRKGLPHALMHAPELVKQGGHHGATCTTVSEAGHRYNLKMPAKFARTYLSRNSSQDGMLRWMLENKVLTSVIAFDNKLTKAEASEVLESEDDDDENVFKLRTPLHLADDWRTLSCRRRTPVAWGRQLLSKDVLVSRDELIGLLRVKLNLDRTWIETMKLTTKLRWKCFGSIHWESPRRTIVGVSKTSQNRRDFVRLRGYEDNTALSGEVIDLTFSYKNIFGLRI